MKIENKQEVKELQVEGNKMNNTDNKLKKKVNTIVQKKGVQLWKKGMEKIKITQMVQGKRKTKKIFIFMIEIGKQNFWNTLEINSRLHRWKNVSKFCEKCTKKGIET